MSILANVPKKAVSAMHKTLKTRIWKAAYFRGHAHNLAYVWNLMEAMQVFGTFNEGSGVYAVKTLGYLKFVYE